MQYSLGVILIPLKSIGVFPLTSKGPRFSLDDDGNFSCNSSRLFQRKIKKVKGGKQISEMKCVRDRNAAYTVFICMYINHRNISYLVICVSQVNLTSPHPSLTIQIPYLFTALSSSSISSAYIVCHPLLDPFPQQK